MNAFPNWLVPGSLAILLVACGGEAPAPAEQPAVEPTQAESASTVVADGATVELVQEGFQFTEGPVQGPDGNLYFSDVRANQIHRLRPDGTVELFRDDTNGANGLAFDAEGRLIAVEGAGGRVVVHGPDGEVTSVLAEQLGDETFRPNDLILDAKGGIYVTDPGARPAPGETPARNPRVFYLRPGGGTVQITDQAGRSNGITLALDGRTLLIADSNGRDILAMDVADDGTASNLRPWATLEGIPADQNSSADGLAIDSDGRLYVATLVGIQVFGPGGEHLETIQTPKQPSNVAFGGPDRRTLYITAREGLYRLALRSQGPEGRAK